MQNEEIKYNIELKIFNIVKSELDVQYDNHLDIVETKYLPEGVQVKYRLHPCWNFNTFVIPTSKLILLLLIK